MAIWQNRWCSLNTLLAGFHSDPAEELVVGDLVVVSQYPFSGFSLERWQAQVTGEGEKRCSSDLLICLMAKIYGANKLPGTISFIFMKSNSTVNPTAARASEK